jgi:hypothetical protein
MNKKDNLLLNMDKNRSKELLTKIKNGRINILGTPISRTQFPLFIESNKGNTTYKQEALKSILGKSKLHNLFFSKTNINHIQQTIIKEVWLQSNKKHLITRQSDMELKIVMRSIFLQNGKHNFNNIIKQIKVLNQIIIDYCVPNILSNIELYLGYKKHISFLPEPLPPPKNMSIVGLRGYNNK